MQKAEIYTGSYLPNGILTNFDLYNMPSITANFDIIKGKESIKKKTNDPNEIESLSNPEIFDLWAKQVTGISQRRVYANDFKNNLDYIGPAENMGAEAAKRAIESAKINPKELDYIIVSTFTNEQSTPDPACAVGHLIGADGVPAIHTNNACAGFIYGLIQAQKEIQTGAKNILVVASEYLTKVTNYSDPKTAVLFADGAGAMVLTKDTPKILGYSRGTAYESQHIKLENKNDTSHRNVVEMAGGDRLLANAIKAMGDQTKKALENASIPISKIKYIVPHQGNGRMFPGLAKNLKIPLEKIVNSLENIGNTSSSSVAVIFDKLMRGEIPGYEVHKGDKIALTAVGVGYTMGTVILEI